MPNWLMREERRRWRRHWLRQSVRILSDEGAIDGFGLRVSEGGMYLFAVADFPVGTRVEVEFTNPRSHESRRCPGVVRNRVVYLYGLEFVREEAPAHLRQASAAKG